MLEKPALDDSKIINSLQNGYAIHIESLEFLPIGYDSSAGVYRVTTEDSLYFLKVKKGEFYEASVSIPVFLRDQGIEEVVAPIKMKSGGYSSKLDDFTLMLFPFIEGKNAMETGLSDSQWKHFGKVLDRIHHTPLSASLQKSVRWESFELKQKWREQIEQFHRDVLTVQYENSHAIALAKFWQSHHDEISKIYSRALELCELNRNQDYEFVLCHSDIHTANMLVEDSGNLHIIDWDDPILAPQERDLMFISGHENELSYPHQQHFQAGYGTIKLATYALAYYRYEWVIQEIAEYGELVFLSRDVTDTTRSDAVREFEKLFAPGDVVDAAYSADALIETQQK